MSNISGVIAQLEADARIADQGDQFVKGYNAGTRNALFLLREVVREEEQARKARFEELDRARFAKGDRLKVEDGGGYTWYGEALDDRGNLGLAYFSIRTDDGSVLHFNLNSDQAWNLSQPHKNR